MVKSLVAAAGAVALISMPAAAAGPAAGGTVSGTVSASGLRTPAGIVVSLHAANLAAPPEPTPAEMDQKDMTFEPHVVAITKGSTVRFLNSDPVAHNVFSPEGSYDLGTWQHGESKEHTFAKAGVYTQLCRLHPEMEGYVVVLDTPYFAVTGSDGHFAIDDVPAGTYTLETWSEKLKPVKQTITVESGKTTTASLTLAK